MQSPQPPGAIAILEAELAETLKAVADCFAGARTVNPERDEYGHRRAREFENAVALLKASAELGATIAKIKGEYNQNINVLHGEFPPDSGVKARHSAEEIAAAIAATKRGAPPER